MWIKFKCLLPLYPQTEFATFTIQIKHETVRGISCLQSFANKNTQPLCIVKGKYMQGTQHMNYKYILLNSKQLESHAQGEE